MSQFYLDDREWQIRPVHAINQMTQGLSVFCVQYECKLILCHQIVTTIGLKFWKSQNTVQSESKYSLQINFMVGKRVLDEFSDSHFLRWCKARV